MDGTGLSVPIENKLLFCDRKNLEVCLGLRLGAHYASELNKVYH